MRKAALIGILLAALAAFGSAQFRMGGFQPTAMMYVNRKDVGKELKLTDEQSSKLAAAQQDMRDSMRQAFQDSQGDQQAMQAAMKKAGDAYAASVKGILNDDQTKRLREIFIQIQGANVLTDPDTQKALKLSDDQIKQIKDLQQKQQDANNSIMQKVRDQEITFQEAGPMFQKNGDALKTALDKVMTDDQRKQLKDMGGAPFTLDPNEPLFGGPGGRRGGG